MYKDLEDSQRSQQLSRVISETLRFHTQEKLVQLVSKAIGLEGNADLHRNFMEMGGDSISAIKLQQILKDQFEVMVPVSSLFEAKSLQDLATLIDKSLANSADLATEIVNIESESELDLDIVPEIADTTTSGKEEENPLNSNSKEEKILRILLTGASGFLGIYLLQELLLQNHTAFIYCLIRAPTKEKAIEKLTQQIREIPDWKSDFWERIQVILGDISKPLLGLSQEEFDEISSKIDVVYHNAAVVNWILPYSSLRSANVQGTKEILRLCCKGNIKKLHYISSLGVLNNLGVGKIGYETVTSTTLEAPEDGYGISKYVSERLCETAKKRGLKITIFRPGTITGHSKTGHCNFADHFNRLLIELVQMGHFPINNQFARNQYKVDITPVDFVAKAIVRLSWEEENYGKIFHLIFDKSIVPLKFISDSVSSLGFQITPLPYKEWYHILSSSSPAKNKLYPFLAYYSPDSFTRMCTFDSWRTWKSLSDIGLIFEGVSETLIHTYYNYFVKCKALEVPNKVM